MHQWFWVASVANLLPAHCAWWDALYFPCNGSFAAAKSARTVKWPARRSGRMHVLRRREPSFMNPAQKALWFIESHLADPLTLDDVAAIGSVSRFHMVRAFAAATGFS